MATGSRLDLAATQTTDPRAAIDPRAELSDRDFMELAKRVRALTGIVLPLHKRQMVISRLRKRLRSLGIADFRSYVRYLDSRDGTAETGELINVVTTNLTSFFRENHHFEDLATCLAEAPEGNALWRLRFWSAACSTGEEPYSIAMTAARALHGHRHIDLRVLATDLNTDALARAAAGVYPAERLESCPPEWRHDYFETLPGGDLRVVQPIRSLVTFKQLNLHEAWPVRGPFDAIFCRNVLIYFDPPDKQKIVARLAELLRPGGTLYLGHSESMLGGHPALVNDGQTIFRKRA
jgi:chemotaxis protein methyltransferase CheR